MSRAYRKKSNLWKVVFTIFIIILVISGIGVLYNHFEADIKLIGKEEIQVIDGIEDEFKVSDIESSNKVVLSASPFVYEEVDLYENMRISKIGIPIKTLTDYKKNQTFTLYVVEGDGSENFKEIEKYKLVIEANTYKSNDVNKWHYFDVKDLKIEVAEGQTLAFCSASDTVNVAFKSSKGRNFYASSLTSASLSTGSTIYIDVYGYRLDK